MPVTSRMCLTLSLMLLICMSKTTKHTRQTHTGHSFCNSVNVACVIQGQQTRRQDSAWARWVLFLRLPQLHSDL